MTQEFIDHILLDEETVHRRVSELGQAISADYQGKDLILICVLRVA